MERYEALFLDLPEDLTTFINRYVDEEITLEELWRGYVHLTGVKEPFVNALRYTMDPILNFLAKFKYGMAGLKVYCYQDLKCHIEASRLSERLLLLETGERVRRRVRLEEWRGLLRDELELAVVELRRTVENISEEAGRHSRNAVLYGGLVKPFKNCMEAKGFSVEVVYLQHYWRSPLNALRTLMWIRGVNEVPDELIVKCVRSHLRYMDYVLSSEDIDSAHGKWTSETQPRNPVEFSR